MADTFQKVFTKRLSTANITISEVKGGEVQALQEDVVGAEALQGGAPEDGGVGLDDTVFDLEDFLGESEEEVY